MMVNVMKRYRSDVSGSVSILRTDFTDVTLVSEDTHWVVWRGGPHGESKLIKNYENVWKSIKMDEMDET